MFNCVISGKVLDVQPPHPKQSPDHCLLSCEREAFRGGQRVKDNFYVTLPAKRYDFVMKALEKDWTVVFICYDAVPYQMDASPGAPLFIWYKASIADLS